MSTRLITLLMAFLMGMTISWGESNAKSQLRDDGIHTESWMKSLTFLDLKEDLSEARQKGKGLVILFEAPGCRSCKRLHEINFQKPELVTFILKHFDVIQINIFGDNEVTDFDGTTMSERKLAHKLRINFTPTTAFYGAGGKELFRMPGYFKPRQYRSGFEFVIDKGPQRNEIFPRWIIDRKNKRKSAGPNG